MTLFEFLRQRAREYECAKCSTSMGGCHFRIVARTRDSTLVEAKCAQCDTAILLHISYRSSDDDRSLRDEQQEAASIPEADPITVDELIDVHSALASAGSLAELVRS